MSAPAATLGDGGADAPGPDWLTVRRGDAPLLVSLPHTGTVLPPELEGRLVSPWLARKDADWWIDRVYAFAADLGATTVHTALSRTAIDVNRDPSGVSLYPGQATTELCPTTTFDGEPLYRDGEAPGADEVAERRARWFDPYHAALDAEVERLRAAHDRVVVYDCHSIRSVIPRLFEGRLPAFNIGTNGGASCAPEIQDAVAEACRAAEAASSSTAASAAATSRAGSAVRAMGCTPCRWSSPAAPTCARPKGRSARRSGPFPSTRPSPSSPRKALEDVLRACLAFARGVRAP